MNADILLLQQERSHSLRNAAYAKLYGGTIFNETSQKFANLLSTRARFWFLVLDNGHINGNEIVNIIHMD